MSNLAIALAWFDLGLGVFPCYEADTWVGDKLHAKKSPRTQRGFYDCFTDRDEVIRYWTANPNHLVGVWCKNVLVVLDVDSDPDCGIDGQFELDENGVVPESTFSVGTPRGGSHHFYLKPEGVDVGPDANLTLPNGTILRGVDRRAGNSYFIAWSEETPSELGELAVAPEWLLVPAQNSSVSPFSGSDREWFERLPQGSIDYKVEKAMERFPVGEFAHDEMRDRQLELVRLGAEGYSGVPEALLALRNLWLAPPWNEPEWEQDWDACLRGAIRKYGAFESAPAVDDKDESFLLDVQKRLRQKKIELEADSLLLAEGAREVSLLSIEGLRELKQEYLVDTFVPERNGIVVLVAKRSMGKTFAYIGMLLSMIFGMPWMGKKTRPAKTLVVLGEGLHGFYERISTWCDYYEKPIEEVSNWVQFVTGVNLNNPMAVGKLKEFVTELDIELCIIDTWAATSGLVDEDSAALVSQTLNKLEGALGNATVLITHHPNKASENASRLVPRGSGAFEGRADVVLSLQPDKDYQSRSGMKEDWLSISTDAERGGKNRGARQETIRGAYLKSHLEGKVWAQDPSSLVKAGTLHVLNHLKGPTTAKDYGRANGLSLSTARRHLNDAVEDGILVKAKGSNSRAPEVYSYSMDELHRRASGSV